MNSKIMLITYANSLGRNLRELAQVLDRWFTEALGGVHILPFFPSSADRGFAPVRYDTVDLQFGSFDDIAALGKRYYLMFDFMLNHISRQSPFFIDFQQKKDASAYRDFFLRYAGFWEQGEPGPGQADMIYKRKDREPSIEITFADGSREKLWCTFGDEQVDINMATPEVQRFIRDTLEDMCRHGASFIRLDAFAYAVKKAGTNCFFVEPDIWMLLDDIKTILEPFGVEFLPEIHEHYSIQMKLAERGYWIYDFALPVLVLHALYNHSGVYLKQWLDMSPMKQFTTLDTHDGIGIVDVKGLLPDAEIQKVQEQMYNRGANVKKVYSSAAYNNLDIYQVNTTFYSALNNNDNAYLLARAIQFFAPGIPQVYYVGLLAGVNDLELMEHTKNGRDINRHYYSLEEIEDQLKRPVVEKLRQLMILRNTHQAFDLQGSISVETGGDRLTIRRSMGKAAISLEANLRDYHFRIIDCTR